MPATSIKFGKCTVLLADALVTPQYVAPCGVRELTMTVNVQTEDTEIPDCDDPDLAAWLQTDIVSKQMRISGNGLLDTGAMQTWQRWWLEDDPADEINVRWFRDLSAGNGGGYFQAPAILTAYEENGAAGRRWRNTFDIAFNGKPVFTPIGG